MLLPWTSDRISFQLLTERPSSMKMSYPEKSHSKIFSMPADNIADNCGHILQIPLYLDSQNHTTCYCYLLGLS